MQRANLRSACNNFSGSIQINKSSACSNTQHGILVPPTPSYLKIKYDSIFIILETILLLILFSSLCTVLVFSVYYHFQLHFIIFFFSYNNVVIFLLFILFSYI
jgi:hypothetical protein